MEQPTSAPSDKLNAATLGAAAAAMLFALLSDKVPVLKLPEVQAVVAPAMAALFAFVPGWLKTEASEIEKIWRGNYTWWVLAGGLAVIGGLGMIAFALVV